ncbi:efflux RND transporter periplasmic adaptor subunit [uncultured Roseobacter sp.]|uniref:efflux RND transporter periplasmic adaptor subunit n=1 Tax=uncultured Roseobacter sp. TaxID=114847 RepID=UPI00262CE6E7|nr:efflux RND transporter periplasmic adaptor subunit [uncultured Roseobacter sp.]
MKTPVTIILAVILVAGTYAVTFGAPGTVLSLLPQEQSAEPADTDAPGQHAQPSLRQRPGRGGRQNGTATLVVTQTLELAPHKRVLRAIGSGVAARSVDVTADVSGMITDMRISPNDRVKVGDILFQLDDRTERLNVEMAQAELDQASQALQRYRSLASSSAVSAVNLADAEIAQRLAEANHGLAQVALEERAVRAPIAGQVGLSTLDIGDRIDTGDMLITIDALDDLLVEFELPERAIGLLDLGRSIRASTPVYVGEVFAGRVVAYDSRLDSVTRSVTVQALIDNSDRRLWSGMTFSVRLEDQTDPRPVVPATAVTWTREGAGVWIVDKGTASRVPVTILYRQGDRIWLDADLAAKVDIVTEGAQKLRQGATVRSLGTRPEDPGRGERPEPAPAVVSENPSTDPSRQPAAAAGPQTGTGSPQPASEDPA